MIVWFPFLKHFIVLCRSKFTKYKVSNKNAKCIYQECENNMPKPGVLFDFQEPEQSQDMFYNPSHPHR